MWWAFGRVYRGVPCFVSGVLASGCTLVLLCMLSVILVVSWVWGGIVCFRFKVLGRGRVEGLAFGNVENLFVVFWLLFFLLIIVDVVV